MSSLPFPPEILLLITSSASHSPSRDLQSYQQRQRTLQALSLVYRSWTRIAQEYLRKEVWVNGFDQKNEEEMERKSDRLVSNDLCRAEYLTVDGCIGSLQSWTADAKWERVKYLRLFMVENQDGDMDNDDPDAYHWYAIIYDIEHFPSLEVLILSQGMLLLHSDDKIVSLPNLRRLVLQGNTQIEDIELTPSLVFQPLNMPNLTALALDETDIMYPSFLQHFSIILKQITVLAVKYSGKALQLGSASTLAHLDRFPKLRHLSLNINTSVKSALSSLVNAHLETLHLPLKPLVNESDLKEFLLNPSEGNNRTLKVDRIIVYGSRVDLVQGTLDRFEFVGGRESPPFEDFDGR